MPTPNEQVVIDFCAAWARRDIDELASFFTPDAIYHNMPLKPVEGPEAIRSVINMFVRPTEEIEFKILAIASTGDTVLTERVDRFKRIGKLATMPVAGIFEIRDGKIAAWRDYFDMQSWTKQTG